MRDRWTEVSIFERPPMRPRLSGLAIEYAILEISSRDAGPREVYRQRIVDSDRQP